MAKQKPKRNGVNAFTISMIIACVVVGALGTAICVSLDADFEATILGGLTTLTTIVGGVYIYAFWHFLPNFRKPTR